MKQKTSLLILLVLLFAIVGSVGAATFGVPDAGEHPYVGLVYFETPSGVYRCSGTLMNSTVVLTAGHCTSEEGQANFRTWVTFDENVVIPDAVLQLSDSEFGDWLDTQPNFVTGTAIPHPLYDDYAQFPATYDVGVVVLSQPVVMSVYGALPSLGYLEQFTKGKGHKDSNFEVVGYGLQGYIKPFYSAERSRYKGNVRLIELNSTNNAGMSAKFTNNPGQGGGSCFGDSGGPVFYNNTNTVVAVVSWGITPCIGVDYQFRVDTSLAQDFLSQFI